MTALGDKARQKSYDKINTLGVTGTFVTPGTGDPSDGTITGALTYSDIACSPPVPVEKTLVGRGGVQAADWIVYLAAIEVENKTVPISQGMSLTVAGRSGKLEDIVEYRADTRIALYELRCR